MQHFKKGTDVLLESPGGPLRPEVQRQLASLSSVLSSVAFGMVQKKGHQPFYHVFSCFIHVFFEDFVQFVQMFIA